MADGATAIDGAATNHNLLTSSTPDKGRRARPGAQALRRWDSPAQAVAELSPHERTEAGTRGSLEVKDKAVERIAAAAVLQVPGVIAAGEATGTIATVLGRAYPRVDVHVAGRRARVHVDVVTAWPRSAAEVAAAVRAHVSDRLHALADLDVDAVDVAVAKVIRPTTPDRRRVQ
ncbi:Asp23/Gls24 family envelope stress response protein [Kineococcus sp. NBC_00420]|uniref:Asp23/Gls24 family envelope stress response protein n=1 Tax=Kineococcus sp. NBC_00420 TaxID=2903564 RepID=UPI002E1B6149